MKTGKRKNAPNVVTADLIESKTMPEPNSGCWLFVGCCTKAGYGAFTVSGRFTYAHRASWEVHRGPIPPGMYVLHRCDNPACSNPDHLFLGTQAANVADREKKGRGRQPRGERNAKAKLTQTQIAEIRSSTKPYRELAKIYGVDNSTISNIRTRKNWRHVD